MKNNKILKQIFLIITLGISAGLLVNFVNPNGIPLIKEKDIRKPDSLANSSPLPKGFINDPYDTSSNKQKQYLHGTKNKEGFVDPENITGYLAKNYFDINALFIDARKSEEYAQGHIKNAINIPYEEFRSKSIRERTEMMKKYNKDGIIVVYCNGGKCEVSIDLAYELARLGFNGVNIYKGGYNEWKESGYPVSQ